MHPNLKKDAFENIQKPSPDIEVFIVSTHSRNEGISIISADVVVLYDQGWNPQVDSQAVGRAHRIGQTKPVTVYRLVLNGTIDQYILELSILKNEVINVAGGICMPTGNIFENVTRQVLQEICALGDKIETDDNPFDIDEIIKNSTKNSTKQTTQRNEQMVKLRENFTINGSHMRKWTRRGECYFKFMLHPFSSFLNSPYNLIIFVNRRTTFGNVSEKEHF